MKSENLIRRLVELRLKAKSNNTGHRCGGMTRAGCVPCFGGKQRTVPANLKS